MKIWKFNTSNKRIMAVNNEKLSSLARSRSESAKERARQRRENREWLRLSQEIGLCIHHYLRKKEMSQKEFAERLNVSPVYVGKLLRGGENLTLETICKLQRVIGETFVSIATPYVTRMVVSMSIPTAMSDNTVHSEIYSRQINTEYILAETNIA